MLGRGEPEAPDDLAVSVPHRSVLELRMADSEPVEHRGVVPPRAVVVPGTRPRQFPAGTYQLDCALIIGWRRESHDERLSLNDVLREFEIAV